jgi:hypothetical protein
MPASALESSFFPSRSLRFTDSHDASAASAESARTSPKTCGWRRTSLSAIAPAERARSKRPSSCAMRAMSAITMRTSPASSAVAASFPRSIASTVS